MRDGAQATALAYAEAGLPGRALAIARDCGDEALEDLALAHTKAKRYELALESAAAMEEMSDVWQALAEIGKDYPSAAHPMTNRAQRTLRQIAIRYGLDK